MPEPKSRIPVTAQESGGTLPRGRAHRPSSLREARVTRNATVDTGVHGDNCTVVEIESIKHKGLRAFAETGKAKGLVGDVERIRKMLAYIAATESEE